MIVERLVGTANPALAAPRRKGLGERIQRAPAVAGRERLRRLLNQSVLGQLVIAMALISGAALIYLNQASQVSIRQFDISDLQHQQIQLRMQKANLYAGATSLQSLQRVENLATSQLHMTKPTYGNIVWIRPVVPALVTPSTADPSTAARDEARPITWMQHALQFIAAQL